MWIAEESEGGGVLFSATGLPMTEAEEKNLFTSYA